jgi:hypothetical protein
MATFTASPARLGFVRIKDVPVRNTMTKSVTITADPDPEDDIALAVAGESAWLTIPETCEHGVAFDVEIDLDELPAEDVHKLVKRTETIEASYDGYTTLEIPVEVQVKPGGPPS